MSSFDANPGSPNAWYFDTAADRETVDLAEIPEGQRAVDLDTRLSWVFFADTGWTAGMAGKTWEVGSGVPASSDGAADDLYIDRDTQGAYLKATTLNSLTFAHKTHGSGATTGGAFATGSWTPTDGRLYLAAVANIELTASAAAIPTLAGNGITWDLVGNVDSDPVLSGEVMRLCLFRGLASGSSAGTATVSGANDYVLISVEEVTNPLATGTNGDTALAQVATGEATGTALAVTLAPFRDATSDAGFSCFLHMKNEVSTPDSGWTELEDLGDAGADVELETQYRVGEDLSAAASWATSTRGIGIAAEVRPSEASASWQQFLPMVAVTTTDRTTTNTTATDIPDLSVALEENTYYEFEATLRMNSSSSAGLKLATVFSAVGASGAAYYYGPAASGAAAGFQAVQVACDGTLTSVYCQFTSPDGIIKIVGAVSTGGNAGNFKIQFAKQTSGTATCRQGSVLKVLKVS